MEGGSESEFNRRYSPLTNRIMRMLTENSRVSVTDMARELNISRKEAAKRLAAIEQEFRLTYTIELSESRLGLKSPHLIGIKLGQGLGREAVMAELRRFYVPQVVMATRGSYDMVVYANAFSEAEYASWDRAMRRKLSSMGELGWDTSEVTFKRFGFFPLNSRTMDVARVPERQKAFLKLLNDNSRMPLVEIARRLGLNYKTTVYNFNGLLKAGYIKRFTAVARLRKDISVMAVLIKYLRMREDANLRVQSARLFTNDEDNPLISRYLIKASLLGAYDSFFMGAFDSMRKAIAYGVGAFKDSMRDLAADRIVYLGVDDVLLGRLPIRSIDLKKEYKAHRSNLVRTQDTDDQE